MKYCFITNLYKKRENNLLVVANILSAFLGENDKLLFASHNGNTNYDSFTVKEREVFVNREWLFPFKPPGHHNIISWFEINGVNEIMNVIEENWMFSCIVHRGSDIFDDFKYFLFVLEEVDGMVLAIGQNMDGDFSENILPKITYLLAPGMKLEFDPIEG